MPQPESTASPDVAAITVPQAAPRRVKLSSVLAIVLLCLLLGSTVYFWRKEPPRMYPTPNPPGTAVQRPVQIRAAPGAAIPPTK